jgi:hypothetical protein
MAETARRLSQVTSRTEVRPTYHQRYQPYVEIYGRAFDQLRDLYEALNSLAKDNPS